ncbi:YbaN family protein [Marinomonas sp. C1424]|uniref:YbaN family protein n=1 Tax=Marinomonas transparens TaxID=2795388 RepID=A0A934JQ25_9GAMM|nr:YbaN family protein [Marinomonas transparens]
MARGKVLIYQVIAVLSLIMAFVGILLPGIPAAEFILLCAWASAKSSPKINNFLHTNKYTGPILYNWNNGKVVSRKSKLISSFSMVLCSFFIIYHDVNLYLSVFAFSGMLIGFVWIWSRPEKVS